MKHGTSIDIIVALALAGVAGTAASQTPYPAKPVRLLIGFSPGGTNDIFARALAPKLTEALGQQIVVENRGGASTAIATELAARAAPGSEYDRSGRYPRALKIARFNSAASPSQ